MSATSRRIQPISTMRFQLSREQAIVMLAQISSEYPDLVANKVPRSDDISSVKDSVSHEAGDFSFITDPMESEMLEDAYSAITSCNRWNFMRFENPPEDSGYMFWKNSDLSSISSAMKYSEHSGASFAFTMREMQRIARIGWDSYMKQRIRMQDSKEFGNLAL